MALLKSQERLSCGRQALLYAILMTLGQRIKAARKLRKLSQEVVAEALGVTKQAVSGWERGRETPEVPRLMPIARRLKVPVEWLLDGHGDPPEEASDPLNGITPDERAAAMSFIEVMRRRQQQVA